MSVDYDKHWAWPLHNRPDDRSPQKLTIVGAPLFAFSLCAPVLCIVNVPTPYCRIWCKRRLSISSSSRPDGFVWCSCACVIYCWSNGRLRSVKTNRVFSFRIVRFEMCRDRWFILFFEIFRSSHLLLYYRITRPRCRWEKNAQKWQMRTNPKLQLFRSFSRNSYGNGRTTEYIYIYIMNKGHGEVQLEMENARKERRTVKIKGVKIIIKIPVCECSVKFWFFGRRHALKK